MQRRGWEGKALIKERIDLGSLRTLQKKKTVNFPEAFYHLHEEYFLEEFDSKKLIHPGGWPELLNDPFEWVSFVHKAQPYHRGDPNLFQQIGAVGQKST